MGPLRLEPRMKKRTKGSLSTGSFLGLRFGRQRRDVRVSVRSGDGATTGGRQAGGGGGAFVMVAVTGRVSLALRDQRC